MNDFHRPEFVARRQRGEMVCVACGAYSSALTCWNCIQALPRTFTYGEAERLRRYERAVSAYLLFQANAASTDDVVNDSRSWKVIHEEFKALDAERT